MGASLSENGRPKAAFGDLDSDRATVDKQLNTCDVARIIGRQEDGSLGDLFRITQAAQGNARCQLCVQGILLLLILSQTAESRSVDGTRANDIHANIEPLAGLLRRVPFWQDRYWRPRLPRETPEDAI